MCINQLTNKFSECCNPTNSTSNQTPSIYPKHCSNRQNQLKYTSRKVRNFTSSTLRMSALSLPVACTTSLLCCLWPAQLCTHTVCALHTSAPAASSGLCTSSPAPSLVLRTSTLVPSLVLRTSAPAPSLVLCTSRYRQFISPQIYPRLSNSQIRSCAKEISTHQQIWLIMLKFLLDSGSTITPQLIIRNSDLAILKIFNTLGYSQMISFPFYIQGHTQTMDQNHWETILGTQNPGSIF